MKIGIIPRIRIIRNAAEYCVEKKLIFFLRKIYKNCSITVLDDSRKNLKLNMLIISGGNDLTKFSKTKDNFIKEKITKFYLNSAIKKKITVVGICYGAQFIANFFKCKLNKTKKHVGSHRIIFEKNNFNLKLKKNDFTNSYHTYLIKKVSKKIKPLARANDNSIEAFKHKKYKIYGVMWHPERNRIIKKFNIEYFKKFK
jgi:putative glutamine amidotransferase